MERPKPCQSSVFINRPAGARSSKTTVRRVVVPISRGVCLGEVILAVYPAPAITVGSIVKDWRRSAIGGPQC